MWKISVDSGQGWLLNSYFFIYLDDLSFFLAAFVLRHPLVASAVFGATKLWQIQEVLNAFKAELTSEIIVEINKIHGKFPNPCPWSVVNAVQFLIKENGLDWLKGNRLYLMQLHL